MSVIAPKFYYIILITIIKPNSNIIGSIEEQEYFGEVLLGIKQIIQSHLREVQGKFQERFHNLETEVKRRDDIISLLNGRIQELESQEVERIVMSRIGEVEIVAGSSSGSSVELPFMVSKLQINKKKTI